MYEFNIVNYNISLFPRPYSSQYPGRIIKIRQTFPVVLTCKPSVRYRFQSRNTPYCPLRTYNKTDQTGHTLPPILPASIPGTFTHR